LFNLKNDIISLLILIMDNLDSDKYYETLLNNFAKNYQYYLNLKAKTKNPINIFIKKNVSWNETNLIKIYYYSNDE
tara:strand:- start:1245 stop:1472 length:228 start_codon:yes stop_codon:yes gene_type:complete